MRAIKLSLILLVAFIVSACQPTAEDMVTFCADLAKFNQAYDNFTQLPADASMAEKKAAYTVVVTTGHQVDISGKKLNNEVVDNFISAAKKYNTALNYLPEDVIVNNAFAMQSLASVQQEQEAFNQAYAIVKQTMCNTP